MSCACGLALLADLLHSSQLCKSLAVLGAVGLSVVCMIAVLQSTISGGFVYSCHLCCSHVLLLGLFCS